MENGKKSIIVPWDFSEKSESSLLHAINIAKVVKDEVHLLYFIKEKSFFGSKSKSQQEHSLISKKLESLVSRLSKEYGYPIHFHVKEGKPREIINQLSQQLQINLLVVGTLYDTGNIQLEAKDFINCTIDDDIPVILNSKPPAGNYYREIVIPVERHKKYKEELKWIIYLSKYLKCNLNFIRPFFNDVFMEKEIQNNMFFTKRLLDANDIIFGIKTSRRGDNFKEEVFNFADNIEADLVLIMSHRFSYYFSGNETEKFPIMVINPRADLRKFQGFY